MTIWLQLAVLLSTISLSDYSHSWSTKVWYVKWKISEINNFNVKIPYQSRIRELCATPLCPSQPIAHLFLRQLPNRRHLPVVSVIRSARQWAVAVHLLTNPYFPYQWPQSTKAVAVVIHVSQGEAWSAKARVLNFRESRKSSAEDTRT